jgi:hypothetical protein
VLLAGSAPSPCFFVFPQHVSFTSSLKNCISQVSRMESISIDSNDPSKECQSESITIEGGSSCSSGTGIKYSSTQFLSAHIKPSCKNATCINKKRSLSIDSNRNSDVADRITIVLTTSPCESTPCTHLIEQVFASIDQHANLESAQKIVVCDGYKVNSDSKVKFRNGVVGEDDVAKYERYINRLRYLTRQPSSCLFAAKLLVLENRHGFAYALWRGIMRVTTEFVLVAQHDRDFRRPVSISLVINALDVHGNVNNNGREAISYIGFPTSTTLGYDWKTSGRLGLKGLMLNRIPIAHVNEKLHIKSEKSVNESLNVSLLPLVQFYDSMHLARTHWYLSRIYGTQRYCTLPRGCFIESALGQFMFQRACDGGIDAVKEFECYLLDDSINLPSVGHINGRSSFNNLLSCHKFDLSSHITCESAWEEIEAGFDRIGDWGSFDWGAEGRPGEVLSGHGSYRETLYRHEEFV